MNTRESTIQDLERSPNKPVVILGGGINGAGLLRELALQGIPCLLVDKADFAAGATSKSSRMIHGGLRYLENREFALVRESLYERNRLLDNAPHYVSPLRTTIPLFSRMGGFLRSALIFCGFSVRPGERGSFITNLGLTFYDWVTRKDRRTPTHYLTGRDDTLREIPGLNPDITASATYWDAWITQAERLCIELIQDARRTFDQCRALNYITTLGVEDGRVMMEDQESGRTFSVEPCAVVNATGAWVDYANAALGEQTRFMGPTKGSHLVVDCPQLHQALGDRMVYYQHTDGRVCIVFPFLGKVIMGSTDIPVDDPDKAECDEGEIQYMLTTLRGVFPGIPLARSQVVFSFCGCRPLPASGTDVTANITRGHAVRVLEPADGRPFPIYSLIGGKWTTFRALAEQAADQVLAQLGLERKELTQELPIGGGRDFPADGQAREQWIRRVAEASGLDQARVTDLLDRYGTSAELYAGGGGQPLKALPGYSVEELRRIAEDEQVVHLDDVVYRRSTIGLLGQATPDALAELADVVGGALGWDASRRQQEIRRATPPVPPPGA
ncbi:MAG: Aerobic glycerol-3-phosphate dehydrogenase [Planctomycetes bacterium ADurb.Bin126]|nr:MAG: Aerobic glycerol-3-phosphate dehydrogenase [Planctomycetes bacterium ADurb.Bin126]HOD80618.1 glycerol-3-phosphate dehydrogenase/oxidase [Phycisphaerae bacterium]HQL74093.1 glycerol-3-phosphate dehydrogenase/oxidase [Phycisphaerae bacterium]